MDSVLLLVLDNSCNRRGLEDKRRDWGIRENMLDLFINVFFFFSLFCILGAIRGGLKW